MSVRVADYASIVQDLVSSARTRAVSVVMRRSI